MTVRCDLPEEFRGRGIFPPAPASGFDVVLDVAEPWGGGVFAGRVERRGRPDRRPVSLVVRCATAWMDIAPQLVGQQPDRPFLASLYDIRSRRRGIWLDDPIWVHVVELGSLREANWLPFHVQLPASLPRALEGTFCALRYQVEARRPRAVGAAVASLPVLAIERRTEPCIRVERTPIGLWRLREWQGEAEVGFETEEVAVSFEPRRLADMPLPGEDREAEILRCTGRPASPA